MQLIKPSFEYFNTPKTLEESWKIVEMATRTCYQSEHPKDNKETSEDFCRRILIRHEDWTKNHGAMLEHGTVYLKLPAQGILNQIKEHNNLDYRNNKYSKVNTVMLDFNDFYPIKEGNGTFPGCLWDMVTTNLRVIAENDWWDDLKYWCEPTKYHIKRYTVKFITDRATSMEFIRHRHFSFAQESQRYCNYSSDKFGKEITYIIPNWSYLQEGTYTFEQLIPLNKLDLVFGKFLLRTEETYFELLNLGLIPQEARSVLPNATKTTLVMTGFESDWEHFFKLRALGVSGKPHPEAERLAKPLMEELIKQNLIKW